MTWLEAALVASRTLHFAGLAAFVMVFLATYGRHKVRIGKTGAALAFLLSASFLVTLLRPAEPPSVQFVSIINTLYGLYWFSVIREQLAKVFYR